MSIKRKKTNGMRIDEILSKKLGRKSGEKILIMALTVFLMAGCLTACGSGKEPSGQNAENDGKLQIVTTIFPEYDWVMNILGDNPGEAEVTLLVDNGVDLHSFQPSAEDIMKISTCDLFIYVGGESDRWITDALKEATNKDMVVINCMEVLGDVIRSEEIVEGMEEEAETAEGTDEPEYDEHVWLSLHNASTLVSTIADAIRFLDQEHSDYYEDNTLNYIDKLEALDTEYVETVMKSKVKTLLFGDRFPFRYLTEDYGLDYYATFAGCSAETEASFETITFLANKVDELSMR